MTLDHYDFRTDDVFMSFQFVSEGPKGRIDKEIQYAETIFKGVYNLALGDRNRLDGTIDNRIITNNKDTQKILATVAASVLIFTEQYPEAWVFATGSTESRIRLYRMGISNNLGLLQQDFDIYGVNNGRLVKFEKNIPFESFVVKRKNIKNGKNS